MNKPKEKSRIKHIHQISAGQYQHHLKRINGIIKNAEGDLDKEKSLARTMANRIEDVDKCLSRSLVCDDLGKPELARIFLNRYKEMTETIQDIRKERIDSILKDLNLELGC